MARSDTAPPRPAPRLYLLLPPVPEEASILAARLRAVAQVIAPAAVLLRPGAAKTAVLRAMVAAAQESGAACLIDGNAALVDTCGADGVHATGLDAFKAAEAVVRPDGIVGIGGVKTKHDAMSAGERADYLMFGEPGADGGRPPFDATCERIGWWAEIFEPPCVGYARTLEEVEALVAAGADFIAVDSLALEADAAGLQELASRLTVPAEAG